MLQISQVVTKPDGQFQILSGDYTPTAGTYIYKNGRTPPAHNIAIIIGSKNGTQFTDAQLEVAIRVINGQLSNPRSAAVNVDESLSGIASPVIAGQTQPQRDKSVLVAVFPGTATVSSVSNAMSAVKASLHL